MDTQVQERKTAGTTGKGLQPQYEFSALNESTVLHMPTLHELSVPRGRIFLQPEAPNWIVTDFKGAQIVKWINGRRRIKDLQLLYADEFKTSLPTAWTHIHNFLVDLNRTGFLFASLPLIKNYKGRQEELPLDHLKEIWLHTNNKCNLSCVHCLVNSNPEADSGLSTEQWLKIIQQAEKLGVDRFYMTGGEPFLRPDIFELIRTITEDLKKELIILTNATLFVAGEKLEKLKACSRERLKLQMSLDGTSSDVNDPIRGKGVFERASKGFSNVSQLGFETAVTAVVTRTNISDLRNLPRTAKQLGAKSLHLMWLHKRGRIIENNSNASFFPDTQELLELVKHVKDQCQSLGIVFDNYEAVKSRVNGQRNVKYDLGNACWESLCVYCDGTVYPSAATSNHQPLQMGNALTESLESIWAKSEVAQSFRQASVKFKEDLKDDPFRYLTGGGDIEHTYFFASTNGSHSLTDRLQGKDPYYELQTFFVIQALTEIASAKINTLSHPLHYSSPVVYHAMGEGALVCGSKGMEISINQGVSTLHSNCVLSFDVDKPRRIVREFYGKAAEKPQEALCCPTPYQKETTSHIPQEVLDRFYGCGSPLELAGLKEGEVMVDLGSGAGIDCFIAAKKVGPKGKVIGVDMTAQMLEVANRNKPVVAQNLGYDSVEFRKGFLEAIPVEDETADLITSNCVINLSPDKKAVFEQMRRVLKDYGRIVISDIVTGEEVPPHLRINEQLWGECISGALSESEFLSYLEQAGFYGLTILKKFFWKEIEGHKFYSITAIGFKKTIHETPSLKVKQYAVYRGPLKAGIDEDGNIYVRNIPTLVNKETALKLQRPPYNAMFTVEQDSIEEIEMMEEGSKNCCC